MTQTRKLQMATSTFKAKWESDLVDALLRSLHLAKEEYRIRVGLEHSLEILEIDPNSVVMCLLGISSDKKDPLSHVQLLLIEAFCHENDIRMLKILCPEELWNIVDMKSGRSCMGNKYEEDKDAENDFDDGLILIQGSTVVSHEDEELRKFYDLAASHYHARPVVRLRS